MGRTIPLYRIASEIEIWKWRLFREALDKQDRKKFDEKSLDLDTSCGITPEITHVCLW